MSETINLWAFDDRSHKKYPDAGGYDLIPAETTNLSRKKPSPRYIRGPKPYDQTASALQFAMVVEAKWASHDQRRVGPETVQASTSGVDVLYPNWIIKTFSLGVLILGCGIVVVTIGILFDLFPARLLGSCIAALAACAVVVTIYAGQQEQRKHK